MEALAAAPAVELRDVKKYVGDLPVLQDVSLPSGTDLRARLLTDASSEEVDANVGLTEADGIAIVTLARPEQHNILSMVSWRRLHSIFVSLVEDPHLRVVVIRGAGTTAFGAGADIKEFPHTRLSPEAAIRYNEGISTTLRAIADLPVPVIAMIGGLAVGGGCELAAACDVRIASSAARFGIPIGRLGVTLGYAEASVLADLIGTATLKYLLFTGRLVSADEALRLGLVQSVVNPADLVEEAATLVEEIVASSEVTVRASKFIVDMTRRTLTAADTEFMTRITVEAYGGDDLKEGVAAFSERRRPQFPSSRRTPHGRT